MGKVKIYKKDGTTGPYFWSDDDGTDRVNKTVYKQTPDGVKRMKGVHFNADENRLSRD